MLDGGECFGVASDEVVDEPVPALFDDGADVGVGDVVAVPGGGQPGAAVSVEEVEPVVEVGGDPVVSGVLREARGMVDAAAANSCTTAWNRPDLSPK